MSDTSHQFLFVYGSLRRGANHPASSVIREYAKYICNGKCRGLLFMAEGYPAAVFSDDSSDFIEGELYRLINPKKVFRTLDRYEGYDPNNTAQSLYLRQKTKIHCRSRSLHTVSAWIYLYNRSTEQLTQIESGDYLSYLKDQE